MTPKPRRHLTINVLLLPPYIDVLSDSYGTWLWAASIIFMVHASSIVDSKHQVTSWSHHDHYDVRNLSHYRSELIQPPGKVTMVKMERKTTPTSTIKNINPSGLILTWLFFPSYSNYKWTRLHFISHWCSRRHEIVLVVGLNNRFKNNKYVTVEKHLLSVHRQNYCPSKSRRAIMRGICEVKLHLKKRATRSSPLQANVALSY